MAATTAKPVWNGAKAIRRFLVPLDSLEPTPGNPRRGDLEAIGASLRRFGQVKPLVVDRSVNGPEGPLRIVAGHHLALAAAGEGWTHVAVVENEFGSEEEARAFLLADNRTAELGSIDEEALHNQLEALRAASSLEGTGYSDRFAADLERRLEALREAVTASTLNPDLDDAPAPPAEPESVLGEVYELGPHRLLCGDATDADALAALFGDERAEVLWTDPPYGVDYVGKTKDALKIKGDTAPGLQQLLEQAFAAADGVLADLARFYIAAPAGPRGTDFRLALRTAGWQFHQALVWAKDVFVLGHSDYHYRHEDILYGWKPGKGRAGRGKHDGSRWYGDHAQASVFEVARPKRSTEHPTMKPVELIADCLRNSSQAGDIVLDPFAGSGSTIIAADILGRRCFAVEIDPVYCDVIRQRYAAFSALPEEARTVPAQSASMTLTGSPGALQTLRVRDLEILAAELGTVGESETLLAAAARLARDLNQG